MSAVRHKTSGVMPHEMTQSEILSLEELDQVASAFAVYPSLTGAITDAARALHVGTGAAFA